MAGDSAGSTPNTLLAASWFERSTGRNALKRSVSRRHWEQLYSLSNLVVSRPNGMDKKMSTMQRIADTILNNPWSRPVPGQHRQSLNSLTHTTRADANILTQMFASASVGARDFRPNSLLSEHIKCAFCKSNVQQRVILNNSLYFYPNRVIYHSSLDDFSPIVIADG